MKKSNSPNYITDVGASTYATLNMASPFQNVSVAFNWLNTEYPTPHTHEHWEIFVVMSGNALHRINGFEQMIGCGDAFLIRPHDRHSIHHVPSATEPYQHLNFIIGNEFAHKILDLYDNYDDIAAIKDFIHFTLDDFSITYIYERALLTQNLSRAEYEEHTKLIISYLLIKYFEQKHLFNSEYPDWLNNFIVYISTPLSFGKSVQELAETTSYSYSRLARIFKSYTGETIVNYVNERKMIYAKRLLRSTDLSTLQISEKIGYTSLSSFNHLFKGTFGITPSEYRRQKAQAAVRTPPAEPDREQ